MEYEPLTTFVRQTLRQDPILWAQSAGIELRPYQQEIARAVRDSILHDRGLTFVVILPRQSGKNELQAQLFSWLLFRSSGAGGRIVSVAPTFTPQTVNNMERVRRSLEASPGTRGRWRASGGYAFCCGRAQLQFYSAEPSANVVGATADLLLSVDEAQDVDPAKFDRDFDPMTASTNATRIFWGTAWTADTLLERERRTAERLEKQDGMQRFFFHTADDIRRWVPAYGRHVDRVIAERGRNHPLVRTQYFCELVEAQGGMFTPARLALVFGSAGAVGEAPLPSPHSVAFLLDVAGMDESRASGGMPDSGLSNPGRDSTTLTVVGVDLATLPALERPGYSVLERHAWTGESHLAVFSRLKNLARRFSPEQIVVDATGVGEGLWSMLEGAFPGRVIPVKYTQQEKSEIGWRFLSVIETGRFCDPTARQEDALARAVREQYTRCVSEILPGPAHTLRWGVPEGCRGSGGDLVHDDFLMADSMVAVLDQLDWHLGTPMQVAYEPPNPLIEMSRS